MRTHRRTGPWVLLSTFGAALFAAGGCFSTDLIGQVFADQVGFTAATIVRVIVGGLFGVNF